MKTYSIINLTSHPVFPPRKGGAILITQFLSRLATRHNVTLVTTGVAPESTTNYKIIFGFPNNFLKFVDIRIVAKLVKLVRQKDADYLIVDYPWMIWIAVLSVMITKVTLVLHAHNIEFQRFRSLQKPWWKLLFYYEKWCYSRCDAVIFASEVDAVAAQKLLSHPPNKQIIVPYGVERPHPSESHTQAHELLCQRLGVSIGTKLIIFFGAFEYKPNQLALIYLTDKIYGELLKKHRFDFEIILCGTNIPSIPNDYEHIHTLGFVDDLEWHINAADVMINPITSGGGVKTKVIESLAHGIPIVSTESGAIGINMEVCGDQIETIPDHDSAAFAEAVVRASYKPRQIAPDIFFDYYGWDGILNNIDASLNEIN